MKNTFKILAVASVIPLFSACAAFQSQGDEPSSSAQSAPVAIDPFAGFEQSRKSEADLAEQTRQDLIAMLSKLKNQHQTVIEPVNYIGIAVTDGKSQQSRQFRVVDSLEASLPLTLRKQAAYDQTVAGARELAEKLADERGTAEIRFSYNPADVRAQKISLAGGVSRTPKNNSVSITNTADAKIQRGVVHLIVIGGPVSTRI